MGCFSEELEELDKAVEKQFIERLIHHEPDEIERLMISMPCREGGLGIQILQELAKIEYWSSKKITKQLVNRILNQDKTYKIDADIQKKVIKKIKEKKNNNIKEQKAIILQNISGRKRRMFEDSGRKGSSTWLSATPIKQDNFCLNKVEFRDFIIIRYGLEPENIPQKGN